MVGARKWRSTQVLAKRRDPQGKQSNDQSEQGDGDHHAQRALKRHATGALDGTGITCANRGGDDLANEADRQQRDPADRHELRQMVEGGGNGGIQSKGRLDRDEDWNDLCQEPKRHHKSNGLD